MKLFHSPPTCAEVKKTRIYTTISPIRLHDVVLSQAQGERYLFFSLLNYPEQTNVNIFDSTNEGNRCKLILICSEYRPVERVTARIMPTPLIHDIIHLHRIKLLYSNYIFKILTSESC
jgi:hypothetical protein